MSEPIPAHDKFIDGVATKDVIIDHISGLRVRIYRPQRKPEAGKLPIILHFHGGGFCISQADWYMYYQMYANLARSANAICVSVYLRLAPEHRFPAPVNDGFSALLWLRTLARAESHEPWLSNYDADFKRVILMGDSSGGNVVHEVAARAGKLDMSPLKIVGGIPIHPGFVRAARSRSELEQPESSFLTLDMVDKFLNLSLPIGSTKDHPFTCPMGFRAPALDTLKLPPFLVCVAEKDLIVDTEMEYYEAMKSAGKEVELVISPGMGHSFYLNKMAVDMDPQTGEQTDRLISSIVEFINKH